MLTELLRHLRANSIKTTKEIRTKSMAFLLSMLK